MITVTLPSNMTLLDWASQVAIDLDPYGAFGRLENPELWQEWAVQFLNNTTLGRNLPNPYQFANWRDWAERFVQLLA